MDPVQAVVDATMTSRETARRLLSENNNNIDKAIHAFRHPRGRVAGFSDLRNRSQQGPERVFTGGEKSGLAVQNRRQPGAPGGSGRGIVDDIIGKAMNQAPSEEPEDDPFAQATGFRLGQSGEPPQEIPGQRPLEHVQRTLTFWSNGFSIDDGPLHSFDDPMTQMYLDRINSGNAPLDLLNIEHNQLVDLRLEDRNSEEYRAKKQAPSFGQGGNRLGSENADLVSELTGEPTGSSMSGADVHRASELTPIPAASSTAAPAAPMGSGDALVQLRLANGSSRRVRVESLGPVQQLYDLVGPSDRDYVLQTPMPPKTLDKDMSIKDAGVKGSVVVQRWC